MTNFIPPFLAIALTGTPGTGKTEVSKRLEKEGYRVLHLTEFIKEYNISSDHDFERNCDVIDMDALEDAVFEYRLQERCKFNTYFYESQLRREDFHKKPENLPVLLIESHMAHYLCDLAVVFRTHPNILKVRLDERGYSDSKVMENILAESIDVVLCDCFDYCRRTYEINTSVLSINETIKCLKELIHALYEDEYRKYLELYTKMESLPDHQKSHEAYLSGTPLEDIIHSLEAENSEGAIIYEEGDNEADYVEESDPVLVKYLPGRNDWSEVLP